LEEETPTTERPGALAYAFVLEGTHIVVFADRVEALMQADHIPMLLAYVVAHEITHILQGVPRHSTTGIMKAHWNQDDHFAMLKNALNFTAYDEDLLHAGLDARVAGVKPAPVANR